MYRILLDTTYILPAFGIELEELSWNDIERIINRLLIKKSRIYVSNISILEAYLKTLSIARKKGISELFSRAIDGVDLIVNEAEITKIDYFDREILEKASEIFKRHNDPFDAIIFSTAITRNMYLLTEDKEASKFIEKEKLLNLRTIFSRIKT